MARVSVKCQNDPADEGGKRVLSVKVFFSAVSGRQGLTLRESV